MKWYLFLTLGVIVVSTACLRAGTRAGYESAAYEVEKRDGKFEVRIYKPLVTASTKMRGERKGDDNAFMRLFRFIGGANEAKEKIAMTTPVFMGGNGSMETMSFVMPESVAAAGTPKPDSDSVAIGRREGGKFAAYRFNGRRTEKRVEQAKEKLAAWLGEQGISAMGSYESAAYDPPFTPPILRRNEVLVRISD